MAGSELTAVALLVVALLALLVLVARRSAQRGRSRGRGGRAERARGATRPLRGLGAASPPDAEHTEQPSPLAAHGAEPAAPRLLAPRLEPPPPLAPAALVRRPPCVVLLHGLLGFDELALGGARASYFRGVPERLRREGIQARLLPVRPLARIQERAGELAARIAQLEEDRVHVIAHSMGGLDARWAIARLGLARRVASLTSVTTPHRGTPLADLAETWLALPLAGLRALGARGGALHDLTTARLAEFDAEATDDPRAAYRSVVASVSPGGASPLLAASCAMLALRAGANDGLVPASSQRHGDVVAEVTADHWSVIGWGRGFDAPGFYVELVREVAR